MMAAPFLQHPDLTTGQKRYLCSIARVYSTDHMRKLIRKQYLTLPPHHAQAAYFTPHENRYSATYEQCSRRQQHLTDGQKRRNIKSSTCSSSNTQSDKLTLPHISGPRLQPQTTTIIKSNQTKTSLNLLDGNAKR
ncbi:protein FAM216A [Latimeria chalumnae]|uniref:protein FAM216A n=1 Tax=Latimeria chalumnae TaxID=7897 RepID=UPI0003C16ABE